MVLTVTTQVIMEKYGSLPLKGAMVEWLEQLDYGAESRRKVVSSRLGFAIWRLEISLCRPSSEWVPFSNYGRLRQRKERDGLRLSSAVPKIQWDSKPPLPPTAIRLWETFTFTLPLKYPHWPFFLWSAEHFQEKPGNVL